MRKVWGGVLVLGALIMLVFGTVPARADGMPGAPQHGSDYLTFAEELRTQGALGFYDRTEDMLRAGKFERAFTRYLFLRANIRGQALYAGLTASVDQRLKFLREQMHLGDGALQYDYRVTYARRGRRAKPACPPAAKKPVKKEPSPEEKPPETVIPGQSLEEKAQATPPAKEGTTAAGPETKPSGEASQKPAEGAQKPGEAAQKPAAGDQKPVPAPPLSFWEKFKRKLKFW
jgi:hypothetical protein